MHRHVAGLNRLMRFQLSPLADDVTPTTLCHIDSMLLSLDDQRKHIIIQFKKL